MMMLLYVAFTLVSLILGGIILLQEGKGGGIGAAFGGVGGEAFGHGSGGINRFTTILAAIFIGLAVVIAIASKPKSVIAGLEHGQRVETYRSY